MDCTYFQNDSGSYVAKRLPAPKNARIKIKDASDLDELKEELREEKPSTEQDFKAIYDYVFDEDYCYDVDVESFEQTMCANRKKLLGTDAWIKKYWHDLHLFIGDFDIGEPELNEEPQVVEDDFANTLIKAGVVEQVTNIEYEHWKAILRFEKLPQLKERCKLIGIKITNKNKDALIHDLIAYEEESPNTLESPILIKALPLLEEKITALYGLYINEIKNALSEFDYPKQFKIAVWDEATDNAEGDLRELLQKELESLSPDKKEQTKSASHIKPKQTTNNYINNEDLFKLTKALDIAFEYEDANGQVTFREFRLDAVKIEVENVYFYGWCKLKNAHRHFRLDRIKNGIILTETGEQFGIAEFHSKYLSQNLIDDQVTQIANKTVKTKFQKIKEGMQDNKKFVALMSETTDYFLDEAKKSLKTKEQLVTKESLKPKEEKDNKKKPGIIGIIIGWYLGLTAIGGVFTSFSKGEILAGVICFFAIGILIPPMLNKINSANKKRAEEKGKSHSDLTQKSANIIGFIIIIITAIIAT
mgnify:CR=1 FL=1